MVTPETVDHLAEVQGLDIDLFAQALEDAGVRARDLVTRSHSGPQRLSDLVGWLNP